MQKDIYQQTITYRLIYLIYLTKLFKALKLRVNNQTYFIQSNAHHNCKTNRTTNRRSELSLSNDRYSTHLQWKPSVNKIQ